MRLGYGLTETASGIAITTDDQNTTAMPGRFELKPTLAKIWYAPDHFRIMRFSSMNTLTLKDLPDEQASSGNSLLSMVMQLSMERKARWSRNFLRGWGWRWVWIALKALSHQTPLC